MIINTDSKQSIKLLTGLFLQGLPAFGPDAKFNGLAVTDVVAGGQVERVVGFRCQLCHGQTFTCSGKHRPID